jgi:GDP-L-fucose synthase
MDLDRKTYDSQTQSMQSHINVGFGSDITINELAHAVAKAAGYTGKISFDSSKPDGAPRKWMSSDRLNLLGWSPKINLEDGLRQAYLEFQSR